VEAALLIEPQGRDSAPAVIAAAGWIAAQDPAGVAVVVPSDHHIPDADAFAASAVVAVAAAKAGRIVTLGVRPTFPATGFGYIAAGAPDAQAPGVLRIERFVEKPRADAAQALVDAGCLWNSGNFVFQAASLLAEVETHAPDIAATVRGALAQASRDGEVIRLGPQFLQARKISIDYALMEKTDRAVVLPIDFAWSDVGAWDAVLAASPRDARGNAVYGDAVLSDCDNCLVRAEPGAQLVVMAMKDCVVVSEGGRTLVCRLDAAAGLKPLVEGLAARGDAAR
jgi:mannose-1-phosphate guanylyltransferase/mannose-6-phosphate isomerase